MNNHEGIKKIVLAYSGGLDTSIIIPWLKENYNNPEIIAVAGNVGQADELEGLEAKAIATGASKLIVADLVDEMVDEARITGLPEITRVMLGHALNCRAMARRCAEEILHKPLEDCRLIVLHLGGGSSARLFIGGRMVDGVRDDEWMFAPERMGGVSLQPLVRLCYSGKYTEKQMMDFIRGKGGLVAHLGTSDAREVERRIADGDDHAKLVYDGMLYSAARAVSALAAGADGQVDRVILTGGIAHSKYVADYLTKKLSFIAPVEIMAGEFELEALAAGACRVLEGQEHLKIFDRYEVQA